MMDRTSYLSYDDFMKSVWAPGFVKQQESISLTLTMSPSPLNIELPTMVTPVFCFSVLLSLEGMRCRSDDSPLVTVVSVTMISVAVVVDSIES